MLYDGSFEDLFKDDLKIEDVDLGEATSTRSAGRLVE